MRVKKLSQAERTRILRKVNFLEFQVDAIRVTVWRRYDKIISPIRSLTVLKRIYFMDAEQTIKYLDNLFLKKKKKHEDI